MTSIPYSIESQTFRFIPGRPLVMPKVCDFLGISPSGSVVIHHDGDLGITFIVDVMGRLVVHGTASIEVARTAAASFVLGMDEDEEGMVAEVGPIVASATLTGPIDLDRLAIRWRGECELDDRLDCLRLQEPRHDIDVFIWEDGRLILSDAMSPSVVEDVLRQVDRRINEIGARKST